MGTESTNVWLKGQLMSTMSGLLALLSPSAVLCFILEFYICIFLYFYFYTKSSCNRGRLRNTVQSFICVTHIAELTTNYLEPWIDPCFLSARSLHAKTQPLAGPKWHRTLMNMTVSRPTQRSSTGKTHYLNWPGELKSTSDALHCYSVMQSVDGWSVWTGLWCRAWTYLTQGHLTCQTGTNVFPLQLPRLRFRLSL